MSKRRRCERCKSEAPAWFVLGRCNRCWGQPWRPGPAYTVKVTCQDCGSCWAEGGDSPDDAIDKMAASACPTCELRAMSLEELGEYLAEP